MKLAEIKTVTRNIEQGGWVRDLPNLPGVSVKVRGTFNSDHARRRNELAARHTPEQLADAKISEGIETDLIIETLLVDWSGIEDLPYSAEAARGLLTDPETAVFRRAVTYAANVVAREGQASIEADAKN